MNVPEWEDNDDTETNRIYLHGFEDGRYIERQEMAKRTCESCKNSESKFGDMFCKLPELSRQEYSEALGFQDVYMEVPKDFGCNKFERSIYD